MAQGTDQAKGNVAGTIAGNPHTNAPEPAAIPSEGVRRLLRQSN